MWGVGAARSQMDRVLASPPSQAPAIQLAGADIVVSVLGSEERRGWLAGPRVGSGSSQNKIMGLWVLALGTSPTPAGQLADAGLQVLPLPRRLCPTCGCFQQPQGVQVQGVWSGRRGAEQGRSKCRHGGGRKEALAGCTCWSLGLPEPARLTRSVWASVLEGRLLGRTEGWLRWGERKQPFAFWGPGGHPARPSLAKFPSPHGAVWATTLSPRFKKLCETRLAHPALCPGPSSPHLGSPTGTPMTAGR